MLYVVSCKLQVVSCALYVVWLFLGVGDFRESREFSAKSLFNFVS